VQCHVVTAGRLKRLLMIDCRGLMGVLATVLLGSTRVPVRQLPERLAEHGFPLDRRKLHARRVRAEGVVHQGDTGYRARAELRRCCERCRAELNDSEPFVATHPHRRGLVHDRPT
jgi:hypothetical protein